MPRAKRKTTRKRKRKKATRRKLRLVKGGRTRSKRTQSSGKFDADVFYKKYSHVVKGSVREVKPGSTVDGVKAVHGRICKIKCKKSGRLRTINVQDAFQVFFSVDVQAQKARERASTRRKKKSSRRTHRKAS